jgi:hypothetical protein
MALPSAREGNWTTTPPPHSTSTGVIAGSSATGSTVSGPVFSTG